MTRDVYDIMHGTKYTYTVHVQLSVNSPERGLALGEKSQVLGISLVNLVDSV